MRRILCGLLLLLSNAITAEELGVRGHHRIPLSLRAGEMARVLIDQTKLDVVVTVSQPGRGIAYEVSNPYDNAVPEEVFVVAERDEEWRLDITPRGATTQGSYTLTIERRPATTEDRKRAEADAAYWRLSESLEKRYHEVSREADAALGRARAIAAAYHDLGDARREAEALLLVSNVMTATEQWADAFRVDEETLAKTRALGFEPLLPHVLNALSSKLMRSDPQRSADVLHEALAAARRTGAKHAAAFVLNRLGALNREVDAKLAVEYFEQAIAIWAESGDHARLAAAYHNIAGAYRFLKQEQKAIEAGERALVLDREVGDEFSVANTLAVLGMFLNFGRRYDEAARVFEEGLSMSRAHGFQSPEVTALIGYAFLRSGCEEWAEARRLLEEAEVVAREVGGHEFVINHLAGLDLRTGHADRALPHLQRDVDEVEQRWATVRGGSLREKFFAHERFRYDALLGAFVQLGREEEAFAIAERSRSRALLSLLSEVRADVRTAAPPELVQRADALQQELAKLPPQPDEATRAEATRITTELEHVEGELRRASPGYRSLTEATAQTTAQVASLLDEGTLLLYYHFSFNNDVRRGFLWALTKSGSQLVMVPMIEAIDPTVRGLLGLLGAGGANRNLTRVQPGARRDAAAYWDVAAKLSNTILGPVRDQVRAAKRIVIVADGALQYVPFAALPMPGDARAIPLADTHEVIYLPSASVLEFLRSQAEARPPAPRMLALFADPVFSAEDARGRGASATVAAKLDGELTRATDDVGLTRDGVIPRLIHTATEAQEIAAILPASQRRIFTGFDATRRAALGEDLDRYRILHFATHGIVDDTHPALSGLLLSLYDRKGREVDGFLRLNDIFQMRLNADLVVLSGCRTGLGKQVRSEGMVGLARGFLYAGAQKVIVSLWNVDDRATAELMARFYRGMLQEELPPAEALRRAQASLRSDPRWAHPYYWAAFTYIGDWR
jgi:CHAT domain-containing protein/tetratricopeptide (TPR) repeat protein